MSIQELVSFLEKLPNEKAREYELSLTKLVARFSGESAENMLLEIISGDYSEKVRYHAFYCLNIIYRHSKDYPKLKELLDLNRNEFDWHVTFDHLEALYNIESDAMYDYTEILKKTHKDAEYLDDNAGFVHLFADVFATIYEKGGLHDKEQYVNDWYDCAMDVVNRAIALDVSYAKYYCTKARILCIKKDYSQALFNIDKAIGLENSARSDYALRIGMYQYYKMMIYTEMRLHELEEKLLQNAGLQMSLSTAEDPLVWGKKKTDHYLGLTTYEEDKPYLFVSYSHKDADKVYPILRLLQKKHVRLWFDVDSIPAGMDYTEHIATKIWGCTAFLPMISSNSVNSEFVRKEIGLADRREKPFFPILLEDIVLSPGMDLQINSSQRIDWFKGTEEGNIELLVRDLPKDVFI